MKSPRLPFETTTPPTPRPVVAQSDEQSRPSPRPVRGRVGESLPHARTTDPDTSHAAAEAVAGRHQQSIAERIRECLIEFGPQTTHEIAAQLGLTYQATSRRVSDLAHATEIGDSGRRRLAATGRYCIVWEALK